MLIKMRFVTALQVEAIFSLEMPLSKPIGNQTPATSVLTSFVTMAKPSLSHDATNAIATTKAPFYYYIYYPLAWIHLCTR